MRQCVCWPSSCVQVQELKEAIGHLNGVAGKFATDACFKRYLRARSGNVKKAEKMLQETLKWREHFKPEALRWVRAAPLLPQSFYSRHRLADTMMWCISRHWLCQEISVTQQSDRFLPLDIVIIDQCTAWIRRTGGPVLSCLCNWLWSHAGRRCPRGRDGKDLQDRIPRQARADSADHGTRETGTRTPERAAVSRQRCAKTVPWKTQD